jgi:hypothetical protein
MIGRGELLAVGFRLPRSLLLSLRELFLGQVRARPECRVALKRHAYQFRGWPDPLEIGIAPRRSWCNPLRVRAPVPDEDCAGRCAVIITQTARTATAGTTN